MDLTDNQLDPILEHEILSLRQFILTAQIFFDSSINRYELMDLFIYYSYLIITNSIRDLMKDRVVFIGNQEGH